MSDVGLGADPRDPRHLALRAVLESQLGRRRRGRRVRRPPAGRGRGVSRRPGPSPTTSSLALAIPLAGRLANGDGRLDVARSGGGGRALAAEAQPRARDLCHDRARADRRAARGRRRRRRGSTTRSSPSGAPRASSSPWPSTGCSGCSRPPRAGSTSRSATSRTASRSASGPATGPSTRGPPPTTRTPCSCAAGRRRPGKSSRPSGRGARDRARAGHAPARRARARPRGAPRGIASTVGCARRRLAYCRVESAASTRIPPPDSSPNSSSTLWTGAPRRRRRTVTAMRTTAISASVTAVVPAPSA